MWGGLRERRLATGGALVAFLPIWIFGGAMGLLVAFALVLVTALTLRNWRCPRCRQQFAGSGLANFPAACTHCGLPAFAEARELSVAHATTGTQRPLSPRVRKGVAGAQVAAGVGLMLLGAVYSTRLP